jgi:hypothetical protein
LRARPASGPCSASPPRQLGQVRKAFPRPGWMARFQFQVDGQSYTFHGPSRACKDEAGEDRRAVAAAIAQTTPSSRVEAASRALQGLHGRGAAACSDEPGTASLLSVPDTELLRNMNCEQLRNLANRIVGFQRDQQNSEGQWVPKTCEDIRAGLLAMGANTRTQALPGPNTQALPGSGDVNKRPASSGSARGRLRRPRCQT